MKYWLIKSEGECYSIDDLKRDKKTSWEGVRNYQARNFMMKDMSLGDLILFYHSIGGSKSKSKNILPGVYGIAKVASTVHVDESQYLESTLDPKATRQKPIWYCVDVVFVKKAHEPLYLDTIKLDPELDGMLVRARGSRLSIQPVSKKHFEYIQKIICH